MECPQCTSLWFAEFNQLMQYLWNLLLSFGEFGFLLLSVATFQTGEKSVQSFWIRRSGWWPYKCSQSLTQSDFWNIGGGGQIKDPFNCGAYLDIFHSGVDLGLTILILTVISSVMMKEGNFSKSSWKKWNAFLSFRLLMVFFCPYRENLVVQNKAASVSNKHWDAAGG